MLPHLSDSRDGGSGEGLVRKASSSVMSLGQPFDASNSKELRGAHVGKEHPMSQKFAQGIASKAPSSDPQKIVLQSFWPTIAVYASADAEELVRLKGIYGGFCDLVKPFGERVYGKVNIRDSMGGSRSWDDFGVHFTKVRRTSEYASVAQSGDNLESKDGDWNGEKNGARSRSPSPLTLNTHISRSPLDQIMQVYLREDEATLGSERPNESEKEHQDRLLPHRTRYLRHVLAPRLMTPQEAFTHPVACLIVASSQSPAPIEKLRDLYSESRNGEKKVPTWAGSDLLRYYVLVHDEDHDDIGRSTMIYEQMKRHFGLHCHLLRLRSTECRSTTTGGVLLPSCTWRSLEESLEEVQQQEDELLTKSSDLHSYLFDTDVDAISMFVREMITQSIVPFMEGRVVKWNDQVVSRRRGISGRFMSLSKRWTGFGSSRGSSPAPAGSNNATNSNFNHSKGFYAPESTEATMQKLADYAFMLRDWKLSGSIYDLLRTDFADDRAWRHQAFVSQMAVTSLLLDNSFSGTRTRLDAMDQSIESTLYSYTTRCADTAGAIRFLVVLVELFAHADFFSIQDASKWATRLLELSALSLVGQAFTCERLASCYSAQRGVGDFQWAAQRRKAAFWSLLAAHNWGSLGFRALARVQWGRAWKLFDNSSLDNTVLPFASMHAFWDVLCQQLDKDNTSLPAVTQEEDQSQVPLDEEKEQLGSGMELSEQRNRYNLSIRSRSLGDDTTQLTGSEQPNEDGFF